MDKTTSQCSGSSSVKWCFQSADGRRQHLFYVNLEQNSEGAGSCGFQPRFQSQGGSHKTLLQPILHEPAAPSVRVHPCSESESEATQSCPTLCDPMDCSPPGSCPWDFPGKSTGVGCHFLLQGIFVTQGSNPGLLHYRQILYSLSHRGSPLSYKSCFGEHRCS